MGPEVAMPLTSHDLRILQLAAQDAQGRLGFCITEEGALALMGTGASTPMPAEEAFPKLEELGLLRRDVRRSYVLTPSGWEAVRGLV
jgi:hypothetical protein